MADDIRPQVQSSLGDGYTIERELGGGGMSRTYVAMERSLSRRVVVRVELWKDADPELQPRVRDVRGRIERLQRRRG